MTFKQKVYEHYCEKLNAKIQSLQTDLADLKAGIEGESKSSAGDKHETSRAKMQLEQENISKRLHEANQQKIFIKKLQPNQSLGKIALGSLVKANENYIYISSAMGKANIEGKTIIAISPSSPLGQKLCGLNVGDNCVMNGLDFKVAEVA